MQNIEKGRIYTLSVIEEAWQTITLLKIRALLKVKSGKKKNLWTEGVREALPSIQNTEHTG